MSIASCAGLMLVAAVALLAEETEQKVPVPSEAAQAEAVKLIKEIYADNYAAAKTVAQKQTLAKTLLEKGLETDKDIPARFTLLRLSRDIAIQAGDGGTAFRAIEAMNRSFQIDALEMKTTALTRFASSARTVEQHRSVVEQAMVLSEAAVAEDRFAIARTLIALASDEGRKTKDKSLIKQVSQRAGEVEEIAGAYDAVQKAAATLKESPTDPEANLTVGRYKCLVKGDWDNGLALLAQGNNAALKTLAAKDLKGAVSSDEQAALGDQWWDLADKEEATAKKQIQGRAGHWYEKAQPGLSGLTKDKVLKRLAGIERVAKSHSESSNSIRLNTWVDVLKGVDIKRDSVKGDWKWNGNALTVAAAVEQWLQLPLEVEGGYDLEVVFIRHDTDNDVRIAIPVMARQVALHISAYAGQASGLEPLGGEADLRKIPASKRPGAITNGQPYALGIKVRPSGDAATIDVTLNGKPYIHWAGKQELLGNWPGFSKSPALGGWYAPTTFRGTRFRLISGSASWALTKSAPSAR